MKKTILRLGIKISEKFLSFFVSQKHNQKQNLVDMLPARIKKNTILFIDKTKAVICNK